jgi:hypothetical protein
LRMRDKPADVALVPAEADLLDSPRTPR